MSTPQPRGRRNFRAPITLVVLVGILVAGAYFGWRGLTADITATAEPTKSTKTPKKPSGRCTPREGSPAKVLTSREVRVSVFNAGGITGLADETLNALHARGFRLGTAENAPTGSGVTAVQVWDARPESPQARLVAMQFEGTVQRVRAKTDLGPGIDVIVGDNFPGLATPAPRTIQIKAATPDKECPQKRKKGSAQG